MKNGWEKLLWKFMRYNVPHYGDLRSKFLGHVTSATFMNFDVEPTIFLISPPHLFCNFWRTNSAIFVSLCFHIEMPRLDNALNNVSSKSGCLYNQPA